MSIRFPRHVLQPHGGRKIMWHLSLASRCCTIRSSTFTTAPDPEKSVTPGAAPSSVVGCEEKADFSICSPTNDEDDPAAVLRHLQKELRSRSGQGADIPPPPRRRSGKTNFFDKTSQEGPPSENATAGGGSDTAAASDARNPFMRKLTAMENTTQSATFPTYDAGFEDRRRNIEKKIKEERARMLVFRDVGMDLDKPILSRDVFLVFKYFRYGMEFAVDNELERMLRYFNEHAVNELKIIQNSKLMRGPATLSKPRRSAPTSRRGGSARSGTSSAGGPNILAQGATPVLPGSGTLLGGSRASTSECPPAFQKSTIFPTMRAANMMQFCAPVHPSTLQVLDGLFQGHCGGPFSFVKTQRASSLASPAAKTPSSATPTTYHHKNEALFSTLTPSTFRRPAVVIYSQLGQKFGSQADSEWRRLAYSAICPSILQYLQSSVGSDKTHIADGVGVGEVAMHHLVGGLRRMANPTRTSSAGVTRQASSQSKPVEIISLRSTDLYKFHWVHRLYITRFAKSLSSTGLAPTDAVQNALVASSTFVGTRLLEPFYPGLGLRNYLAPHVMLVDHEGTIRWLSAGCPDEFERHHFPTLVDQLAEEYYRCKLPTGSST